MQPTGRIKKIKGFEGKVDYHVHDKTLCNWWEICNNVVSRTTIKKMIKDEIEDELIIIDEQED